MCYGDSGLGKGIDSSAPTSVTFLSAFKYLSAATALTSVCDDEVKY